MRCWVDVHMKPAFYADRVPSLHHVCLSKGGGAHERAVGRNAAQPGGADTGPGRRTQHVRLGACWSACLQHARARHCFAGKAQQALATVYTPAPVTSCRSPAMETLSAALAAGRVPPAWMACMSSRIQVGWLEHCGLLRSGVCGCESEMTGLCMPPAQQAAFPD